MISISVDSDEEEAAVLEALKAGTLGEAIGRPFNIKRGRRTIGGRGESAVVHSSGNAGQWPASGGAGGTGTCTVTPSPA